MKSSILRSTAWLVTTLPNQLNGVDLNVTFQSCVFGKLR
jgi:hypothetical protein